MTKKQIHQICLLGSFATLLTFYQNCAPGFAPLGKMDSASILDPGGTGNGVLGGSSKINPFTCDGKTIAVEPVRRLTRVELENTLKNLVGATAFAQVSTTLGKLYSDTVTKTIADFSQTIDDTQMSGYQGVAEKIYSTISTTPAVTTELGAGCALTSVTPACRETVIKSLGLKAFRRPLTAAEFSMLQDQVFPLGTTGSESVAWVVYTLVLSPNFLLHIQVGETDTGATELDLSPYEVASRLSYMIGDTPPDSELFAAAAANKLKTLDEIKPHVDRLFKTSAAKEKIHRFFDYWLQPRQISPAGLANDFVGGLDVAGASQEYLREMREYIDYVVFTQGGTLNDLITSRAAFPRNDAAAQVLGAAKLAMNNSSPSQMGPERMGLLMRPSILATDGNEVHPIVRGAKFQTRFLCDTLGIPAGAALAGDLSFTGDAAKAQFSTRVRTERLTGSTSCMTCHSKINPMGFAFDNFDNLGRIRTVEKTYSSAGTVLGTHPVDNSVQVLVDQDKSPAPVANGVELIEMLMERNRLPECFSKQMHRFYRLRNETGADSCVLNGVYSDLMIDPNRSVLSAFKKQVLNAALLKRRLL